MYTEQWYSDVQADALAGLARSVRHLDGLFIEIGVWQGKSFSSIAQAVIPNVVCAVDTWRGNEDESTVLGSEHTSVTLANERDVYQEFIDNMRALGISNYAEYRTHWREFLIADISPIAFLHIDASHDYQSVRDCIAAALPHMLPGSVMCGDDYLTADDQRSDLNGGVMRAVKEMLPTHSSNNNLWVWVKD